MATTLSFNPTRIRHPPLHSHKPISQISSFSVKINYPLQLTHLISKKPRQTRPGSVSESSVSVPLEAEGVDGDEFEDDPTAELSYLDPEVDPDSISEWELDFCSRPILDIRGKKIWELVVCDSSLSLQYTKYFPNNVINSVTLKEAMEAICEELDVPLPEKVRYFRYIF